MYARLTTRTLLVVALFICSEPIVAQKKGSDSVGDRLQALENQVATLQAALAAEISARQNADALLADVLVHFSREGNDIYIRGANLHVVNGLGQTGTTNGLGNVIIGYNEERSYDYEGPPNDRSGSHMLVVGSANNYSSYGGIVSGANNNANGRFSSVTAGRRNSATGNYSSVTGGANNTASGWESSVAGGSENTSQGGRSSVTGGQKNTASGDLSSVTGGDYNTASGIVSSVSGGKENTASGYYSSISGGYRRIVTALYEWIAGTLSRNSLSTNGG